MDLNALAGNAPLKRQLSLETARRGLSHAYIVSGPTGSGRHTLAHLLAAALVCTSENSAAAPCGRCAGCRKALSGIHPDVISVSGEDGKDLTVAQVRALRADAYIRPNEAARKVYLVESAHTMNQSAQNAMLKLLEEGPAYAAFLLLTENAAALLPTVRSRCEVLTLSPVSVQEAEAYLTARFPQKSGPELHAAALESGGILGRAVQALEGGDSGDRALIQETGAQLLDRLSAGNERSLAELCVSLEKWNRDQVSALMDELILLLRSALVAQAGGPCDPDKSRQKSVERAASALSPAALLSAVKTADQLRTACGFNVGVGHLCGWLCAALSANRI